MRDGLPPDHWTPELVSMRLTEAIRWLHYNSPREGPSGMASGLPDIAMTLDERLEAGWDPLEEDELPEDWVGGLGPHGVARMHAALLWSKHFIIDPRPQSDTAVQIARCVNASCASKALGKSFKKLILERGINRTQAYTLRDRGLSIISQSLAQKGVPPWPRENQT